MVAWLLKCNISRLFFMNLKFFLQTMWNAYFSCSKQTFYIIRMPISYSRCCAFVIFKYTSLYIFFMATKVNRSTKSDFFYKFQKIIIKKRTTKNFFSNAHALLDHFYLLISLEGMSTFIRSWASFENQIWDVHLYNL